MSADDAADAANIKSTASALDHLTDHANAEPNTDPKAQLHREADRSHAHSWFSKFVPSDAMEKLEARFANLHMGNFVIERHTGKKEFESMSIYVRIGMHLLYYGSEQEKVLQWQRVTNLLKDQSVKMGKAYDDPASVNHIQPFIDSFKLQDSMKEMKQPDPKKYKTFNEFFGREIREDARPIDSPSDQLVSSSPADCRLTAFQTIDMATKYWIKGFGFSIEALLGDAEQAKQFEGGSIVIARLAPQDYHRWHSPVDGKIEAIKDIPGDYYTVNPQAINEPGTLDVFCENKRSVCMMRRTPGAAPIAVIAVGAMLVGSIKWADTMKAGAQVKRGQCMGAFYYGGSTVIVLYPKGEIVIDEDIAKNSNEQECETLLKVGWRVGTKKQ